MNILVATERTQGEASTDFCETVEGEAVIIPSDCLTNGCTCDRGCDPTFLGIASGNSTTTTMIVSRPDLDRARYASLIADGLRKLNLISPTCLGCDSCEWVLEGHLLDLDFIVGPGYEGDVLQRTGGDYFRRVHGGSPTTQSPN